MHLHLNLLKNGCASAYGDASPYVIVPDCRIKRATAEDFLREIAHDKPVRFSRRQLARYTSYYSTRLGSGAGGSGTVYKGKLPIFQTGSRWR